MIVDLTKEYNINSFNDERLQNIDGSLAYKMQIDGQDVFIKELEDNEVVSELIAMELLDILNIPRVKIALGYIAGKKCLISYASYNKPEEFILASELFQDFCANNQDFIDDNFDFYGETDYLDYENFNFLHSIWGVLEWYLKKHNLKKEFISELLDNLITQFLFSCINNINDFSSKNWALLHTNDKISIYPIFDQELLSQYFEERLYNPMNNMGTYYDDKDLPSDKLLLKFLQISDKEVFIKNYQARLNDVFLLIKNMNNDKDTTISFN